MLSKLRLKSILKILIIFVKILFTVAIISKIDGLTHFKPIVLHGIACSGKQTLCFVVIAAQQTGIVTVYLY